MSKEWADKYVRSLIGLTSLQRVELAVALLNGEPCKQTLAEYFWVQLDDGPRDILLLGAGVLAPSTEPDHI